VSSYFPRIADHLVEDALKSFGAVVLEGPRAAGKTTTGHKFSNSSVSLDSAPELAALAESAPELVLAGEIPRLIDEWQLAPTIWNSIRHEVDVRKAPGQYIITGSATPTDTVTHHSGAGRFARITLSTMSLAESGESTKQVSLARVLAGAKVAGLGGPTVADYASIVVRGGWPSLVVNRSRSPLPYLRSYLSDISRIDIPALGMAEPDPLRMRALVRATSRNLATEANYSLLAREAEISPSTVRKYLDALSKVFVLDELPAWAPHLRSRVRIRTSPKLHFVDPSLAAASIGANPTALLDDLNTFGFFFESLAIRDLRVYAAASEGTVQHFRDETGLEVDAIVEDYSGNWSAFEIKMGGSAAIDQAAANLKALANKVSKSRASTMASLNVVTAGKASFTRPDGVNVISLGHLTQ